MYYRSQQRAASARPKPIFETSKWRVVSARPLAVADKADESQAAIIGDLEPGTTCDVLYNEIETGDYGSKRACIIGTRPTSQANLVSLTTEMWVGSFSALQTQFGKAG